MNENLPRDLRRLAELLEPLGASAPAQRALDRLRRDLLPRTAPGADDSEGGAYLIAGIVGPNNAGKSALFNALTGRELSPSLPTGGATRRLFGAAHPSLLERLRSEPTLARFELVAENAEDDPPHAVFASAVEGMPPGLFLIDTPDFDSILLENRRASESLLAVADLAIVVVTKHSYQNREVVEYLEAWLAHGRPWLLVYNEAPDEGTTRAHADKLASDLSSEPVAVFRQPFDMQVQDGAATVEPRALEGGGTLREFLHDLREVERIKDRALRASLGQLRGDLGQVRAELDGELDVVRGILDVAMSRARAVGYEVARAAMPAGPLLEAFATVLDNRGNPLNRGLRGGVRRIGQRMTVFLKKLRPGTGASAEGAAEPRLARIEGEELASRWQALWEGLARDLGPEARAEARREAHSDIAALLDADLAEARRAAALERAVAELGRAQDYEDFERVCETLVENAIDERGYSWDMQIAADLVTVTPLAVAALIIVKTGGLGIDVGVAGGGAVSTVIAERMTKLLGAPITQEARARWSDLRGEQLAEILTASALAGAWAELHRRSSEYEALSETLRTIDLGANT